MSTSVSNLTKDIVKELNNQIVVLDTETTGFSKINDRIVEFGAVKLVNGKTVDTMSILINPEIHIPQKVIDVHGITNQMVKDCPNESYYTPKIIEFLQGSSYIVGHNVSFDIGFIEEMFKRCGYNFDCEYLDTCKFAKRIYSKSPDHKLGTLANYLNIKVNTAHRALADVETTVALLRHLAWETLKY